MIRLHAGRAWKLNPQLVSELRAASGDELDAPIRDFLSLEVDGIDLLAGLTEDSLLEVTAELARATARLMAGRRSTGVTCSNGGVELLLERQQNRVLLSLVQLRRPAKVVLRGVELDLLGLARATLSCGKNLLTDLRDIHPSLVRSGPARRLATVLRQLSNQRLAARVDAWRSRAQPPVVYAQLGIGRPSSRLELNDPEGRFERYLGGGPDLHSLLVDGRFELYLPGEEASWSIAGCAFLFLKELTAAALDMVRALEANDREHTLPLEGAELVFAFTADPSSARACFVEKPARNDETEAAHPFDSSESFSCSPLLTLTAIFEATVAFVATALSRNRLQRSNPYLTELHRSAREGLAHCQELRDEAARPRPLALLPSRPPPRISAPRGELPLAPGRLRRLSYRKIWESTRLHSIQRIGLDEATLVAIGERGAAGFSTRDGSVRWSTAAKSPLVAGDDRVGFVVGSNQTLRHVDSSGQSRPGKAHPELGSPLTFLQVLNTTGPKSGAKRSGPTVVAGSSTDLIGLSWDLEPAWHFAPPGSEGLHFDVAGSLLLAWSSDGRLYALNPKRGEKLWRFRCGSVPTVPPVLWRGAPRSQDALVVAAQPPEGTTLWRLSVRTGRPLPLETPSLDRVGSLLPLGPERLLISGAAGERGCVCSYDGEGKLTWRIHDGDRLGSGIPRLIVRAPEDPGEVGNVLVCSDKGLAALDSKGNWVWFQPLPTSPLGETDPLSRRGVVFVATEEALLAFDNATGQSLGQIGERCIPRDGLAIDEELTLFLASERGPLQALSLRSFLSLV